MRQIAILTFLTLDGVMQGPMSPEEDTSDNFTQGGWAANYYGEVMQQVTTEAMTLPYDLLFGRKTYDIFTRIYAKACKNFSLNALCFGGLYIGGGIAARNLEIFKSKQFMEEFFNNIKMKSILKEIPILVIRNYNISLYGSVFASMMNELRAVAKAIGRDI